MAYNWVNGASITLPNRFYNGSAVVYNGKIHILGSEYTQYYHYELNGETWTKLTNIPIPFYSGSAVVYNGKIHILGGSGAGGSYSKYHYSWNGTSWTREADIPYQTTAGFAGGAAVVYNNKIHIFGGFSSSTQRFHYSFDGTTWTREDDLSYGFSYGCAVVYENKIHLLGSSASGTSKYHYSWDGETWTRETDISVEFYRGAAVVCDDKIYIIGSDGGYYHNAVYCWDGTSWTFQERLPDTYFYNCPAVVYAGQIHALGGVNSPNNNYYIRIPAYNRIKYGDKTILDVSNLDLINNDVVEGKKYLYKDGTYKTGTRPRYYKFNSSDYLLSGIKKITSDPDWASEGILFDGAVSLRVSGTYIQLYGLKSDGVTESSINVVSVSASYKYGFVIDRIHYIDRMTCFICYRYQTSDTLYSGDYVRAIIRKYDGTLLLGSALQITSAPSTSQDVEYFLMRNLWDNQYCWVRKQTTLSNNSAALTVYFVYYTSSTGAITYVNSAYVNVSGAVVRWADYIRMGEMDRGGIFYKNNSNVYYYCVFYDYIARARNLTVASSPDLAEHITNPLNAHFLGKDSRGRVVISEELSHDQYSSGSTKIVVFDYDNTVTTNNFKFVEETTIYDCAISPYNVIDLEEYPHWKLPYSANDSVFFKFNGTPYLIGGTGHLREIYEYSDYYGWNKLEYELPYDFKDGAVLAEDWYGIYLLGGNGNGTKFYFTGGIGNEWVEIGTIPYNFYQGLAFRNNNGNIEIIGGYGNNQKHYEYDQNNNAWTTLTNFPTSVYNATLFRDYYSIWHIFGSQGNNRYHYYYIYDENTGTSVWKKGYPLLYDVFNSAVVQGTNNEIHIFGGGQEYSKFKHARLEDTYYDREWKGLTYRESDLPIGFTKPVVFGTGDEGYIVDLADNTKCVEFWNFKNITHIVSFINDVITLSNGVRYQVLYNGGINSLETVVTVRNPYDYAVNDAGNTPYNIGPESDMYNGISIY